MSCPQISGFFYLGEEEFSPPIVTNSDIISYAQLFLGGDRNYVWVHQLHAPPSDYPFLYSRLYALPPTSLILIMIFIFHFGGKCPPPPQNLAIFRFGGNSGFLGGIPPPPPISEPVLYKLINNHLTNFF